MSIKIPFLDVARRYYRNMNPVLLICTILLMCAGAAAVYSATGTSGNQFFAKQLIWYALGFIFMMIFANINYNNLLAVANWLYVLFMLLLILVLVMGQTSLGAQRWLKLAGFQFQPSEFMKIVVALALIRFILVSQRDPFSWGNIGKMLLLAGLPIALIIKQPDLGTSILLIPLILAVFFMGNMPAKKLWVILGTGIAMLPVVYLFLKDYQKQRIMVFLNPQADPLGAGYNIIQSQIAVGSGGFFGKGWAHGTQSQLNFIPIKYTDFIYAVISEEFGFLGTLILLLIYYFLIMEGLKIVKLCKFTGGKMLAAALTTVIFMQIFINIGMNIGMMPVTGITLPLLSYGGTSVLVIMIMLGILQNIYREYVKAEE
ncbi:MAG: rod shape-determining protein RodA [Spirochaetia bacterium]|nr:rod shape-determining protein RodA [Spirochaetia bacterium]